MPEIKVTTEGVRSLLNKCNPSKECGSDKIPDRIFREYAYEVATLSAISFNVSLRSGRRLETANGSALEVDMTTTCIAQSML